MDKTTEKQTIKNSQFIELMKGEVIEDIFVTKENIHIITGQFEVMVDATCDENVSVTLYQRVGFEVEPNI